MLSTNIIIKGFEPSYHKVFFFVGFFAFSFGFQCRHVKLCFSHYLLSFDMFLFPVTHGNNSEQYAEICNAFERSLTALVCFCWVFERHVSDFAHINYVLHESTSDGRRLHTSLAHWPAHRSRYRRICFPSLRTLIIEKC